MATASPLARFLMLYGGLFAAFGVASPFLPGLLQQDGLSPGALGTVLAAGTAIRLIAGPIGGRLADRARRPSRVLTWFAAASALIATFYAPARGLALLLPVSVAHAAVLAPLTPVADALTLGSARARRGFDYGWVRGAGSAAFIGATLLSGLAVDQVGLGIIVWLNACLLAVAALISLSIPDRMAGDTAPKPECACHAPWTALLRSPMFLRSMAVASLVGGSHALHDGFGVIRWRAAGLSAGQSSILWSMSVIGEMAVFLCAGRPILTRLGPGKALTVSAIAGMVRWGAAAQTAAFPVMAFVEPLHGLTFALLHLACVDVIARTVPKGLAATAQAFYATIAMGATSAIVTLACGPLYGHFGAAAFWAMAGLCCMAIPLAHGVHTSAMSRSA